MESRKMSALLTKVGDKPVTDRRSGGNAETGPEAGEGWAAACELTGEDAGLAAGDFSGGLPTRRYDRHEKRQATGGLPWVWF